MVDNNSLEKYFELKLKEEIKKEKKANFFNDIGEIIDRKSKLEEKITVTEIAQIMLKNIEYVQENDVEVFAEFKEDSPYAYKSTFFVNEFNPDIHLIEDIATDFEIDKLKVAPYFTGLIVHKIDSQSLLNTITLDKKEDIKFFKTYFVLDNNVVSDFNKYIQNKSNTTLDFRYEQIFNILRSTKYNVDALPYIYENFKNGFMSLGRNFKFNKKNAKQLEFFNTLKGLYKEGVLGNEKKSEKEFLNSIIKNFNKDGFRTLALVFYFENLLFLLSLLKVKVDPSIKEKGIRKKFTYLIKLLRELDIPVKNRYLAIAKVFFEKKNHPFFQKLNGLTNQSIEIEKRCENITNVAADLVIFSFDEYIYHREKIVPFLLTSDYGLFKLMEDVKPDFVVKISNNVTNCFYQDLYHIQKDNQELLIKNREKMFFNMPTEFTHATLEKEKKKNEAIAEKCLNELKLFMQ